MMIRSNTSSRMDPGLKAAHTIAGGARCTSCLQSGYQGGICYHRTIYHCWSLSSLLYDPPGHEPDRSCPVVQLSFERKERNDESLHHALCDAHWSCESESCRYGPCSRLLPLCAGISGAGHTSWRRDGRAGSQREELRSGVDGSFGRLPTTLQLYRARPSCSSLSESPRVGTCLPAAERVRDRPDGSYRLRAQRLTLLRGSRWQWD